MSINLLSRSLDSKSDGAKLYMFYMSNENITLLSFIKIFLGVEMSSLISTYSAFFLLASQMLDSFDFKFFITNFSLNQ